MIDYVKLMRLDHWIKQVFVLPGVVVAMLLLNVQFSVTLLGKIIIGYLATCFVASANYIINEWLDANFDKYHPVKKNRVSV